MAYDGQFSNEMIQQEDLEAHLIDAATMMPVGWLLNSTIFWWRVRAINNNEDRGEWSVPRYFQRQ